MPVSQDRTHTTPKHLSKVGRESRGFEPHRDCARSAYQRGSGVAAGATVLEMTPTCRPPLLELNMHPTSNTSLFFEMSTKVDKTVDYTWPHTPPQSSTPARPGKERAGDLNPNRACARSAYQRGPCVAAGATAVEMTPTRPPHACTHRGWLCVVTVEIGAMCYLAS